MTITNYPEGVGDETRPIHSDQSSIVSRHSARSTNSTNAIGAGEKDTGKEYIQFEECPDGDSSFGAAVNFVKGAVGVGVRAKNISSRCQNDYKICKIIIIFCVAEVISKMLINYAECFRCHFFIVHCSFSFCNR